MLTAEGRPETAAEAVPSYRSTVRPSSVVVTSDSDEHAAATDVTVSSAATTATDRVSRARSVECDIVKAVPCVGRRPYGLGPGGWRYRGQQSSIRMRRSADNECGAIQPEDLCNARSSDLHVGGRWVSDNTPNTRTRQSPCAAI